MVTVTAGSAYMYVCGLTYTHQLEGWHAVAFSCRYEAVAADDAELTNRGWHLLLTVCVCVPYISKEQLLDGCQVVCAAACIITSSHTYILYVQSFLLGSRIVDSYISQRAALQPPVKKHNYTRRYGSTHATH